MVLLPVPLPVPLPLSGNGSYVQQMKNLKGNENPKKDKKIGHLLLSDRLLKILDWSTSLISRPVVSATHPPLPKLNQLFAELDCLASTSLGTAWEQSSTILNPFATSPGFKFT